VPATATGEIAPRRQLVLVWLVAAALLGGLLSVARLNRSGGDDPDPARQRPGLLDLGSLPAPAPPVAGLPRPGRRAVVFFVEEAEASALCANLARRSSISGSADVAVVVAGDPPRCPVGTSVPGGDGEVARAAALVIMTVVAARSRRPVSLPLLWLLAGHLVAMFPDFLFSAGIAHYRWMEVFLGHIASHFVPGRNLTWYGVWLVALGGYLVILDRLGSPGVRS